MGISDTQNLITFVTCVRDQREDFMRECANSVAIQDGPVEWIVVDDGSADAAAARHRDVVLSVQSPSHRVVFERSLPNQGLSIARNRAFRHVKGDWVVVVDSDDRVAQCLSQLLRAFPSSIQLVCCAVHFFDERCVEYRNTGHWKDLYAKFGRSTADPFLWFDFYYHGLIARAELIAKVGGYNESLRVGEDQDILFRICEQIETSQVAFTDEVGYYYRRNPQGICHQYWSAVRYNYEKSMLQSMNRRGAQYSHCRFVGRTRIDSADVETYMYERQGALVSWEQHAAEFEGNSELLNSPL